MTATRMQLSDATLTGLIIKALREVPSSICPIIKGASRNLAVIYVSIPEDEEIPAGWKPAWNATPTYPKGWQRIQKNFLGEDK